MNYDDLKKFWSRLPAGENVHPDDRAVLASRPHQLQTEVVPGPWYFNLDNARLFILMANPGRVDGRDLDEFYGHGQPLDTLWRRKLAGENIEREMLEVNARHQLAGHRWFLERLRGTIEGHSAILDTVCVLNLVPYRSTGVPDYRSVVKHLPSVEVVKTLVHQEILPRARAGQVMLVAARDVENWGLKGEPETDTVCIGGVARGGHLTPNSKHGPAIRAFLSRHRSAQKSPPTTSGVVAPRLSPPGGHP